MIMLFYGYIANRAKNLEPARQQSGGLRGIQYHNKTIPTIIRTLSQYNIKNSLANEKTARFQKERAVYINTLTYL